MIINPFSDEKSDRTTSCYKNSFKKSQGQEQYTDTKSDEQTDCFTPVTVKDFQQTCHNLFIIQSGHLTSTTYRTLTVALSRFLGVSTSSTNTNTSPT